MLYRKLGRKMKNIGIKLFNDHFKRKTRPNDISSHIQLIYKQKKSAPFHFCNETNRITFSRNSSPIDFNKKKYRYRLL